MRKMFGKPSPPLSDQSKPDGNEPPPDAGIATDLGTPPPGEQKNNCIYLDKDFVDMAGLDGLEPGQMFTLRITGTTKSMGDDGKLEADISDASMGEIQHGGDEPGGSENDMESSDEDSYQAPKGRVEMGPGKMKGF